MVIWLIGMSGSGKTTIGKHLFSILREKTPNTVFVDGDDIRDIFNQNDSNRDYSISKRRENAERIIKICKWLDSQKINVVCCILSIFQDQRNENRKLFSSYFEIFIDASLDTLIKRDSKNLYGPAQEGKISNVVGFDIPFERPVSSDLIINNSGPGVDINKTTEEILQLLEI